MIVSCLVGELSPRRQTLCYQGVEVEIKHKNLVLTRSKRPARGCIESSLSRKKYVTNTAFRGCDWVVKSCQSAILASGLLQDISNTQRVNSPSGAAFIFKGYLAVSAYTTVVRRWRCLAQARSVKLLIALLSSASKGSTEPGMYLPVH